MAKTNGSEKENKVKKVKDPKQSMKEPKVKKVKDPNQPMKETKVKKIKDPNEPKKALTSYFIWLSANRPTLKEKNPEASATDIARAAGKEWKEMDPADKKTWELKAAEDKIRYSKAMESYKELKQ
uniref:HMG box domain-containing protein n=2 Tax=Rhabditophanes sp. KR3021 TaxID=114890 RepID=A0AC35TKP5_9BILA